MAFTWNVQPYERLEELRAEYTNTIVAATRNRAEQVSVEATEWMKQNAPWQDRPDSVRQDLIDKGRLSSSAPHAREALNAYIPRGQRESATEKAAGLSAAKKADRSLLNQMNVERQANRLSTLERTRGLSTSDNPADRRMASRLKYNLKTQQQYKQLKSLPAGKSAVKRFEAEWVGMQTPIVNIVFDYGDRISYDLWLEIANQGRYGIISKALDYWGPKLMEDVRRIARLKQYRDSMAFTESISPEQRFQEHVDDWNEWEDKPYRPWTPERQATNRKRRAADRRRARKNQGNQSTKTEKSNVSNTGSSRSEVERFKMW